MKQVIPRGTAIPFKKSFNFTTEFENQDSIAVEIF